MTSFSWRSWCQLIRLPNVCTVIADTTAAYLCLGHQLAPVSVYLFVLGSVCLLYWAGMILNDVWDIETDRRERPTRPLPAGAVSITSATYTGWAFLGLGVVLGACSGMSFLHGAQTSLVPGGLAIGLALMIVLYDGPLKSTAAGPVAMGGCRTLSFLLAASGRHDSVRWNSASRCCILDRVGSVYYRRNHYGTR